MLINGRISIFSATISTRCKSVFGNPDVAAELADVHDKYVVVAADKASNNIIVFVLMTHYNNCFREELGLNTSEGNPTYTCTSLPKEEILDNYKTVLLSFGISTADEDLDLSKLYWIPKLHKDPYTQRYMSGSAKCSTKSLSQVLTRVFMAVTDGLQKY